MATTQQRKKTSRPRAVNKIPTGIPGFDHIGGGGLPENRVSLVCGTAGSAKTVFALQFLASGLVHYDEPGIFVTFEETADALRANSVSLGWDIARWERERKWHFIDASPPDEQRETFVGDYDFTGLLLQLGRAVEEFGARRVAIDSLGAIFTRFPDPGIVRSEVIRIVKALRQMGVTGVLTAERADDYGPLTTHGVEEFAADNVIILRNSLTNERRRRTVEILKYRGTVHQKGEYPMVVHSGKGVEVIPLSASELTQESSEIRITSGNAQLDAMCGGGMFRDSIILVSGATGTGKTLMTMQFVAGGAAQGERCLLFAFEESRQQLFRNAAGWGHDLAKLERAKLMRVLCRYPETQSLEDHLVSIKDAVREFKPTRIAIDSLSALQRVATERGFREFVIGFSSFIKQQQVAALCTTTTPSLLGGETITDEQVSTLTDSIIMLRYVEKYGEVHRALTVLKMRGSAHDKQILEFTIDNKGMHIGQPLRDVHGILGGAARISEPGLERWREMFTEG